MRVQISYPVWRDGAGSELRHPAVLVHRAGRRGATQHEDAQENLSQRREPPPCEPVHGGRCIQTHEERGQYERRSGCSRTLLLLPAERLTDGRESQPRRICGTTTPQSCEGRCAQACRCRPAAWRPARRPSWSRWRDGPRDATARRLATTRCARAQNRVGRRGAARDEVVQVYHAHTENRFVSSCVSLSRTLAPPPPRGASRRRIRPPPKESTAASPRTPRRCVCQRGLHAAPPQSATPPNHVYYHDGLAAEVHEERHAGLAPAHVAHTPRAGGGVPPWRCDARHGALAPNDAGDTAARWRRTCAAVKCARSGAR